MIKQFVNDRTLWKEFDQLFLQIKNSQSIRELDGMGERVDGWNIHYELQYKNVLALLNAVTDVLRDEIRRTERLLYKSRGKRTQVDWVVRLNTYTHRLRLEISIVDSLKLWRSGDFLIWQGFFESFKFSINLVAAAIRQVEKQIQEGDLPLAMHKKSLDVCKKVLTEARSLLTEVSP